MPHVIIEYSVGLMASSQVDGLLAELHRSIVETQLFTESHIKLRAYAANHSLVGGESKSFIHVQLRIKPGRRQEQKQLLSSTVLQTLQQQPWADGVMTVEVVDMDGQSYAKADLSL